MIISWCDSRVHATFIFGAEQGEFFIDRNIANLVPPFSPDGPQHGTSAAVEYAVTALNVSQLIILRHSNCDGVKGCLDMCRGHAPQLGEKTSFVGRRMDFLGPRYEAIKDHSSEEEMAQNLEKQTVLISLTNLMTFPFVEKAVQDGSLSLHGLWTDIGEGSLEAFDLASQSFKPI